MFFYVKFASQNRGRGGGGVFTLTVESYQGEITMYGNFFHDLKLIFTFVFLILANVFWTLLYGLSNTLSM